MTSKRFLFSIDLEEFYTGDGNPDESATALEELVDSYLSFLDEVGGHCTFFVVGDVARKFPSLLKRIEAEGHELGCHGDKHIPLDQLDPARFRDDLLANIRAIAEVTSRKPTGYRAPLMSVSEKTSWVYEIMASLGISYSSSVIPASTPLYGWPGFGQSARMIDSVLEIPATLVNFGGVKVPFSCGTYFRLLPLILLRRCFFGLDQVVGYFHPYDIDCKQRWNYQKELAGRPVLNHMLFVNRKTVIDKLKQIVAMGYSICTYSDFVTKNDLELEKRLQCP
ncbi:polysaccharide deacetylase family protein [Puniceicoccaceae bacterium K14]|nr:polysaccharide deacetylase family protein [Puniceicoccaceae bacterium K14]